MKLLLSALLAVSLQTANAEQFVGTSPWGKHDELGR